jgi:hypothetical protein
MTVAELIKRLQECDQDKEVFCPDGQFMAYVTSVAEDEHGVYID